MAVTDAVLRKLPGVISNPESVVDESFAPGLEGGTEYPQYTRPAEFRGWSVPEVLVSGDHGAIARWRAGQVRRCGRRRRRKRRRTRRRRGLTAVVAPEERRAPKSEARRPRPVSVQLLGSTQWGFDVRPGGRSK